MSFLAQLRTQQSKRHGAGLQLCYLLQVDECSVLSLGLYLANLEQGQMTGERQPYCIARQHLVMPPPFLGPADGSVLRALLGDNEQWLQEHQLQLRLPALLQDLVATGKAFAQVQPGVWRRLSIATEAPIEPCWVTLADGSQYLAWQAASARIAAPTQLWHCGDSRWLFYPTTAELAPTFSTVAGAALELVANQASLSPASVAQFHRSHGRQWQELGLPLPRIFPTVEQIAEVQPLLHMRVGVTAKGTSRDELCLSFRLQSERVCQLRELVDPTPINIWSGNEVLRLQPDGAAEQQWLEKLTSFTKGFTATGAPGVWISEKKKPWQQLLLNDRRKLETLGFAFTFDKHFTHHYVAPADWQVDIQELGQQWQLALSFSADGKKVDVLELLKQLQSFTSHRAGEQIEITIDGRILVLPKDLIGSLTEELADLLEQYKNNSPLPGSQLYRITALKQQLPEASWHGGEQLQQQAVDLHSSPVMLDRNSCEVQAELRSYQWLGVCWLQHLTANNINGLLADDMGLGKTLQTLAHLSLEHKNGRLTAPALIVAPTSLLGNWQAELQRFCPQLSVRIIHGQNRRQWWQQDEHCDVLITSYHLLVRDLEQWQARALSWLILDEAQTIKNPRTQMSQAVRELQAKHRLCLSGTPVENHLGELWSLLDFLQPGILGSQRQFQQYYQKPIEQDGKQQRLQQLLERAAPFMLRRTKAQVAADLPPKTVIEQNIVFDDQQHEFYQQIKSEGWQQLTEQLENAENNGQKQILLLTALTRLRQACCDPELLGAEVSSAKTEYCLEMLQQLVAEKRAVLVFSQFTKMLDIIARELRKRDLPYLQLTGQSKNRGQLVEAFQQGDAPIFLISLKAGGVGLNLTRADTVIHFDPWWNAAAEDQASDRAHRIGQTQPVFVYKLIAEGTIEEKIARLQQAKANISAHVNLNAQSTGETFALQLQDLLALWQEENQP